MSVGTAVIYSYLGEVSEMTSSFTCLGYNGQKDWGWLNMSFCAASLSASRRAFSCQPGLRIVRASYMAVGFPLDACCNRPI